MFTHLHGHSTFSFLEAIGKIKNIISKCKSHGMTSIAITDYNGMYGIINFYLSAIEEGIKPIMGVEVGFVLDIKSVSNVKNIGNICLLAKNNQGYLNLMQLTSFANQQGSKNKAKIDIEILRQKSEGIICLFGGEESWIGKAITNGESESKIIEIIEMIKSAVGKDNVVLEVTAQHENKFFDLKKINNLIIEYADKTDLECVVNNNFCYPNQEDKEAREMALAIRDGNKMFDEHRRKPKGEYHIMSEDEIIDVMISNGYNASQVNKRIQNNNNIAESIDVKINLGQYLFPNYESPEEIKDLYERIKDGLVE